ncbi:PepSY domain-containing protein [Polaribacter sargassicola]|uniref:PepSY domain-containing protein n=1 Tax=Polaribacter sargassicola TaxID=2836891 RepID=UPI001F3FDEEE|nr:PepSY domain-containing protein [Polaribacter sp. DS7-9]MCG1036929.1 PepSY domain-containing protein [Polaribacter sp. DS7-9]
MTISIWRYSHLTLAISSTLFIVLASITGIILAFEPISNKLNPYDIVNIDNVSVAETIDVLQKNYDEVITLDVDENGFVATNVFLENGENATFYINPKTGEKIGDILEKKPIFEFATSLHRSLFLKSTGRFIIGFVSFLLFLIAITGIILIAKRQGGFSKFFTKVIKENFNQYYHIVVGKYALIPILIITITGVYLSLEKFSLLPKDKSKHIEILSEAKNTDFNIFKTTKLSEVEKIEFPFSTDEEDYYYIKLADKEIAVHQITGQIISEKKDSFFTLGSYYSLLLHTGKGSFLWSLILLLACFAILFFIFSGFAMTLKRTQKKSKIKNKFTKDEAEFIILFGSETGSTLSFANSFYKALIAAKKTAFITDLNNFTSYKKAKNIIVFTATYGEGDAPINATKFIKKINTTNQHQSINFSVIAFGSKEYKHYCKFGMQVHASLLLQEKFKAVLPIHKVNNQSFIEFEQWVLAWSSLHNLDLNISKEDIKIPKEKEQIFTVLNKTKNNIDDTFLIELKPSRKTKFKSGDLLSITPKDETRNRLYSVAKINKTILLSVKRHEFGFCSNFLNNIDINDKLVASIQPNKNFHFPKKTQEVILIANGTGLAPFLGMMNTKKSKTKIHLFWGGRTKESLDIYKKQIDLSLKNKTLTSFYTAFSQAQKNKVYIQDVILSKPELIANTLKNGNHIMICGSLNMYKGVLKALNKITKEQLNSTVDKFIENNQIKSDCY